MSRITSLAAVAAVSAGLLVAGSVPASAHAAPHTTSHAAFHPGHHAFDPGSFVTWWHPFRSHHVKHAHTPVAGTPVTVASGLLGPLTFDVARNGTLFVGQAFSGTLTKVDRHGTATDLVGPDGTDLAAVSVDHGTVTWNERVGDEQSVTSSVLQRRTPDGRVRQVADLLAYDAAHNPDGTTAYGFTNLPTGCTVPPDFQSTGGVDSHGYGSVTVGKVTYVADAGGNDVLRVDRRGHVSTVAVLPPKAITVTADIAAAFGLPGCVAGATYLLEAVPTDVEVGPDGWLYVSSLPGGPEDGSFGAVGSVYKVNPRTGQVKLLATGLAGATGLAVAPDGTVFAAELYAGDVVSISKRGVVSPFVTLPQPAGVEWHAGKVYVSTNVLSGPVGEVVAVPVR
jgi:hypothetical protein